MKHATELIRQIIRKQGLHTLYPGRDESAFGDLLHTAWCLTPDTLVYTSGGIKRIGDAVPDGPEGPCSFGIFGKDGICNVSYYVRRPATTTFKITLNQGYGLEATGDHPILVLTPDGPQWVDAGAISRGDLVAVQSGQNTFGTDDVLREKPTTRATCDWWPDKITEDLAYIVGLFIADGTFSDHRVIIYNFDREVIDFLGSAPAGLVFKYEGDGRNICDRIRLVEFLRLIGVPDGVDCYTKTIPKRMLYCSKSVVAAMLRGMFDGAGHSNRNNGTIGYSSSSKQLIDELRVLLLNFGIVTRTVLSNRGEKVGPNGKANIPADEHRLTMSTMESETFYDSIGFRVPYKQAKRERLSRKPLRLMDKLTTERVKTALADYTKEQIRKCGFERHLIRRKKSLTVETVRRLVDGLGMMDGFILDRLAETSGPLAFGIPRISWIPVKSVSSGHSETVDVRVDDSHNFTANGIITHNCQVERTLYKFRARPHCRSCYNPDRPADSVLYDPGECEYGIITYEDLLARTSCCPRCNKELHDSPVVAAEQDVYGGSTTILYRGASKVFNMWCVAPSTNIISCCGITTIGKAINRFSDGYVPHVHGLDGINPIQAAKTRTVTDTLIAKTELGYDVECSPEHQLLVLTPTGPVMKQVGDMATGDLLGIQHRQEVFGNDDSITDIILRRGDWTPTSQAPRITPELAYIIGLFIAGGSYSSGKLVIDVVDDDIIAKLVTNTLGLNFIAEPQFQRISLSNVRFIELLMALGFPEYTEASTKSIPDRLLRLSRQNILAMLSGMFDGGGHSSPCGGYTGYSTSSIVLRDQVRMLLLNIGIITRISQDKRTTRIFKKANGNVYENKLSGGWQVLMSTAMSSAFYGIVGSGVARKQLKSAALRPERQMFYGIKPAMRRLRAKYGNGCYGSAIARHLTRGDKCTLDMARLVNNWDDHSDDSDYKYVLSRIDEITRERDRIIWLPIKSLTPSKSELCEISVDSTTNTYIANGIISHNSQVSRTVILAYIKKEDRDRKNSNSYRGHIDCHTKPVSDTIIRFLNEAREVCKYNHNYQAILSALERLAANDERPYDGIIGKLVEESGMSRSVVTNFIKTIRLRSFEFTDSPINRNSAASRHHNKRTNTDGEED